MSYKVSLDLSLEKENLLLDIIEAELLIKYATQPSELRRDFIKIFTADIFELLNFGYHLLFCDQSLVDSVIQSLVHSFLWFAEPG